MDRRGPNGEEARLHRASQVFTPGWTLCDLALQEHQTLRLYGTDLCEMLYAFEIGLARGSTNSIAAEVALETLDGTYAAEESGVVQGRLRGRPACS